MGLHLKWKGENMASLEKIQKVYKSWDIMTKIAAIFVLLSFISKTTIFVMTGKSYMFLPWKAAKDALKNLY